jgi:Trypsin-like peptidase domain
MISADETRAQVGGEALANNLRNNVVRVVTQFSDDPVQQNGFGFVVGERGGFLYIVTANHVVRGDVGDRVPIATGVFFFQDQGKEYRGDLLTTNLRRSEGDVAVVRVQTPPGLSWRHDVRTNVVPARGADVWFVGLSENWYVPPRSGAISGVEPNGTIRFEGLNVRQGASGAPLIAETGILGMVVRAGDIFGEATPIEDLERAFREWQYPWQITTLISEPQPPTRVSEPQPPARVSEPQPPARVSEPQPPAKVTTVPRPNVPPKETRLTPADVPRSTTSSPALLTNSMGRWAVGSPSNCQIQSKSYSLSSAGDRITWLSGSGNTDIETIVYSGESEFRTTTVRSIHPSGHAVARGTSWTYSRIGPDRIRVSPSDRSPFLLARCP